MPANDSKPPFRTADGHHAVFMPDPRDRRLVVYCQETDLEGREYWEREIDQGTEAGVLEEMALSLTPPSPSSIGQVLAAAHALVKGTRPETSGFILAAPNGDGLSLHQALADALMNQHFSPPDPSPCEIHPVPGASRRASWRSFGSREEWEAARDGRPWPPAPADEGGAAGGFAPRANSQPPVERLERPVASPPPPPPNHTWRMGEAPPLLPPASFDGRVGSAARGVLVKVRAEHDAITLDVSNGRDGASGYVALLTAVDAGVLSGHLADAARFVREGPNAFLKGTLTDEQVAAALREPGVRLELIPPAPPSSSRTLTRQRVEAMRDGSTEFTVPGVGYVQRISRGELAELAEAWLHIHTRPYATRDGAMYCTRPGCGICARNRRLDGAPMAAE